MNSHDPLLDYRARLERTLFEAEERRSKALINQRSPNYTHDTRVRVWEHLHQVRLPKNPAHALLLAIAEQTGLTLAEVQEVQRARIAPPAS